MNLYILRHAIAAHPGDRGMPAGLSDFDRPLTAEGRRKLRLSIAGIEALGVRPDLVVTSPLVRAVQTAEIFAKIVGIRRAALVVSALLAPGGNRRELIREIDRLAQQTSDILLVGHEPDLGELIGLLCAGSASATFELKKGGLAKLESAKLRHGRCATLAWLLTPKQLRGIG
ncbi:MAG TPA: histidine phosphatase family protein [Opitutaceae bacterium]|nr:histidine phosphatase family protein [Opitutaceae bacterium]